MNCERAERLLPLHAGGDLEDGRERAALAAHLGGCERCRRREAEWAESVSLLSLHEPPEFDAAFFDPIRRNVMREITADIHAKPSLATQLAQLLRPKPLAYAASLALVCAALLFAFRLSRAPQPSKLASDGVASSLDKLRSFDNETSKRRIGLVFENVGARGKMSEREAPLRRNRVAPQPSPNARESARATTPRGIDDDASSPSPARAESPNQATANAVASAPNELPTANVELAVIRDEREMLKIDLQTRDPDVRIIWFSPQPDAQASPRSTNDKR